MIRWPVVRRPLIGLTLASHGELVPDAFMEHPTGEFETAVHAMADGIRRLRALPDWSDSVTFCAQGMGPVPDTYHFAKISILRDEFALDEAIEPDAVAANAGVAPGCLSRNGKMLSIAKASPEDAARILDVIFRQHKGIKPHTGEGDDYAVGAEWDAPRGRTAIVATPPKRPWWRFW